MDVRPLTVEGILRTNRRDRPLLVGFLLLSLLEAAHKLWPEFDPEARVPIEGHPLTDHRRPAVDDHRPFLPVWRRPRGWTVEDDEGGI